MIEWDKVNVGDRLLIKRRSAWDYLFEPFEVIILEFSPSRNYVKIRKNIPKIESWIKTSDYKILEKLEVE